MPYSVKDVRDRHDALKTERAKEHAQWREIAEIMDPDNADIGTASSRTRTGDDIYDSTPMYAVDQFKGGLFTQSTNPADRWFELGIEDKDLGAFGPVRDYLYRYGGMILRSAGPAVSDFYAQIPSVYELLGVYGSGVLYSDLPQGAQRFTDVAVPLNECYYETDSRGHLTRFDREFRWKGARLWREFGDAAKVFDEKREYTIVHGVFDNPDFQPGRIGPRGQRFTSVYCCADSSADNFRVERGYYEMPYSYAPWRLRAGRYPTGPGHRARADALMLNEMERSHIVAGQFAAEGLYLGWDESTITAADIQPGRVLHGAVSEAGKQLLQRVEMGTDVRLSMAQSEQRRAAIRQAFYFDIMQLLNRPQMTATEVMAIQETNLRLIGPYLGQIHSYFLSSWISRRARMLGRAGLVPPPPQELRGQSIEVEFVSPLAKALKLSQARGVVQLGNQIMAWAQAQPNVLDKFNFDKASEVVGDGWGAVPGVIRSDDETAAMREARAQAQAQATAIEQGAGAAKIYADVAHANQAQTRSAQREKAA
jgi:hypothetical protein